MTCTCEDNGLLERPIFIIGGERSGTTWLQREILAWDGVVGGQESHFFNQFCNWLKPYRRLRDGPRSIGFGCYLAEDEVIDLMRQNWRAVFGRVVESDPGAKVLLEKTPGHAMHTDAILQVLPRARFIHMVRDGRDAALSMVHGHHQGWAKDWAPARFEEAILQWKRLARAAHHEEQRAEAGQVLRVYFEDLKNDHTRQLNRVADFLGVEPVERRDSGGRFGFGQSEPTGFHGPGEAGGWRRELSWRKKRLAWKKAGDLLEKLGYPRK